jgi:DNA-binding CsgD family transcriptional regulator
MTHEVFRVSNSPYRELHAERLPITARELEVLQAWVDHGSAIKAAAVLGISPGTVKVHLKTIRLKTGVDTTTQAVLALHERLHLAA